MKNKSYQGHYLEDGQTDHQYKQVCLQLSPQDQHFVPHDCKNLSVLTVENTRTSNVNVSEPVYQTIEEILKNNSSGVDDSQDTCERKSSEEKEGQKMIFSTKNKCTHKKKNLVYGIIRAKGMARYRPCSPDIVRR